MVTITGGRVTLPPTIKKDGGIMKHTKGKWLRGNRTDVLYIESDNGERLANVCINLDGKNNSKKIKEGKANANLIASAPELLQALIDMRNMVNCWTPPSGDKDKEQSKKIVCNAIDIIAKAEGK